MKGILNTLAAISFMLVLAGCQKEVSYVGSADNSINLVTPDPVNAPLIGNVFNENNQPAAGVTVKVGSQTVTTDAKGFFRFNNASLDKTASLVTAELNGYFKAYRVFSATAGANEVNIKLIKKNLTGTIDAATGGEVSLSNGSKVKLPAGSVVDAASGAAYSGSVQVYASYIDPTASDIFQTIPGSLQANDKNGSRVTLNSFGMLAVELWSTSGQKLQIKPGMSSTITTAIPSSKQATAPASIALWSVDENTGIWKEEGTATKNGNVYVGEATHFSFWNCDVASNAVSIHISLQTSSGPLIGAIVRLTRVNGSTTGWGGLCTYGYTDSLGHVGGMIPYNEALVLDVLDQCGNVVFTQNVGPYTSAANVGPLTVPSTTSSFVNITGTLVNCSGAPITSGVAIVNVGYSTRYVHTNASGQFSLSILSCTSGSSVNAIGIDSTTQQQSAITTVPVTSPTTSLGTITACGSSSAQFINYTVDGTSYSITSAAMDSLQAYVQPNGTSLQTNSIAGNHIPSATIYFTFNGATGPFVLSQLATQSYTQTTIPTPITVNLTTAYPTAFGQYYEGNFAGNFMAGATTHTISCSFRVRRLN